MKKFKKVMASTIALASVAAQATAFASVLPEEVVGTKYEEPVQVLAALKIMVHSAVSMDSTDRPVHRLLLKVRKIFTCVQLLISSMAAATKKLSTY